MDNFQSLLSEAAKLKEHTLKKERKNFENLPEFLKNGLSFEKKYQKVRNQHYLYQLHVSHKIKT